MPAHSRRSLEVDWMVSMVSMMVLLVAVISAVCVHHSIIVAGLWLMEWLGLCWLVLIVAGRVEGLRMPPVALRLLLQRLHGARGPLAVVKGVASPSFMGCLMWVVPVVMSVTLAYTLIQFFASPLD